MANPNPNPTSRFQPGSSGNPTGATPGAKRELGKAFYKALLDDFNKNGAETIAKVRTEKPDVYFKIAAEALPAESRVDIGINQPEEEITEEQSLRIAQAVIDSHRIAKETEAK